MRAGALPLLRGLLAAATRQAASGAAARPAAAAAAASGRRASSGGALLRAWQLQAQQPQQQVQQVQQQLRQQLPRWPPALAPPAHQQPAAPSARGMATRVQQRQAANPGLKFWKPTSPGVRGRVTVRRTGIWRGRPMRCLSQGATRIGGRNAHGRITVRHRGGGPKRRLRQVDFQRIVPVGVTGRVERLEYDPNRTGYVALVRYDAAPPPGGRGGAAPPLYSYVLAPQDLAPGDTIAAGPGAAIRAGNTLPLRDIPVGMPIHCIELQPLKGAVIARAAGCMATIVNKQEEHAIVRLPSGEQRLINLKCRATIGAVSNPQNKNRVLGSAGASRHAGRRPTVRGVAMNPVDHPMGGGTAGGRPSCSPWGLHSKGKKTRDKNKASSRWILSAPRWRAAGAPPARPAPRGALPARATASSEATQAAAPAASAPGGARGRQQQQRLARPSPQQLARSRQQAAAEEQQQHAAQPLALPPAPREPQQPAEHPLLARPSLPQQRRQQQQPRQHPHPPLPLPARPPGALQRGAPARERALLPAPLCELAPAALTRRVKRCATWRDAAVLFAQQSLCMNAVNLAALLCQLAQLRVPAASRPVNWRAFVAQALCAAEPQLAAAAPRQLSNMAWALASLGYDAWADPAGSWGPAWRAHTLARLHGASCRDVSNVLWALATTLAAAGAGAGARAPLVLQPAETLLSDGALQRELLSALHRELPRSAPQDVANAMWALAALRLRPPPELGQFLLARAQAHFGELQPRELATTLWAAARLGLAPAPAWLDEALLRQVGRPAWAASHPRHAVMCLSACAALRQRPPSRWLEHVLPALQAQLLEAPRPGARDLASTMWALGRLRVRPNPGWLDAFMAASAPRLAASAPQELAITLWGLAALQATPSGAWLAAFDDASLAAMPRFTAHGLAELLAGQVHLGLAPSGAWAEAWMRALRAAWGSADAAAMVKALWAAAKLRLPLGRAWLSRALADGHDELAGALADRSLPAEQLLRLVWAVGRLCRGALGPRLADLCGLHCCRAAPRMTWEQLTRGASRLARLHPLPAPRFVEAYGELAAARGAHAPPAQAAALAEALGELRRAADAADAAAAAAAAAARAAAARAAAAAGAAARVTGDAGVAAAGLCAAAPRQRRPAGPSHRAFHPPTLRGSRTRHARTRASRTDAEMRLALLCALALLAGGAAARGPLLAAAPSSNDACGVCKTAVHVLSDLMCDPMVDDSLAQWVVDNLCPQMPDKQQCADLVAGLTPAVVEWVRANASPDVLCADAGVCGASNELLLGKAPRRVTSRPNDVTCPLCMFVAGKVKETVADPATLDDIRAASLSACASLPEGALRDACGAFVDQYEMALLRYVATMDPAEVCMMIGTCLDAAVARAGPPRPLPRAAVAAAARLAALTRAPPSNDGEHCDTCKVIVTEMRDMVANPELQVQAEGYAKQACDLVPSVAETCKADVAQYAPMVFGMVLAYLQPEPVCVQLKLCPPPPSAWAAQAAVVAARYGRAGKFSNGAGVMRA
ncbi:rplB [Scenedesmus sp. PABB004]|nr:rplB [Scenedesmus sp. PABB004]